MKNHTGNCEQDLGWDGLLLWGPDENEPLKNRSLWESWNLSSREGYPVISLVGAGGKTSVLTRLAWECKSIGRKAIVTTTTHIRKPENWTLYLGNEWDRVTELLRSEDVIWLGSLVKEHVNKIGMPEEALWEEIMERRDIPLLIEADGAKRKPFKIPGKWEPVLIKDTTHVIAVLGLDALHQPWKEKCFRWENAAEVLGETTDVIRPEDYVSLLLSEKGLRKEVPGKAEYKIVLNKADTAGKLEEGLHIRSLLKEKGFRDVYITYFSGQHRKKWL